jgi:uncharacterized membrane protein
MMNGYDMTGWNWFGMAVMMFVAVVIVGVAVWALAARRPADVQPRPASARERLDARLADGEIDAQEHRERLDALRGNHART